jgi:hypothetical protein
MGDTRAPLPEYLIVDASLLLVSTVPTNNPAKHIGSAFLKRIATAALRGDLLILVPILVLEECFFKIICYSYEALGYNKKAGSSFHAGYKQHPELIAGMMPVLNAFHQQVTSLPAEITGPDDLILTTTPPNLALDLQMLGNIDNFHVLPKDAYILAEARRLGVDAVATMDGDWRRATGFTVFIP